MAGANLLSESYDVPRSHDGPLALSYIICSTPRSGSTLLGEAMRSLGLGVPGEYLETHEAVPSLMARWGCTSVPEYLDKLRELRTANDVFGVKAHWHQAIGFAEQMLGPDMTGMELEGTALLIDRMFGNPAYIHITRRDRDRQAVSHWIALQTGRWMEDGSDDKRAAPKYDFRHLTNIRAALELWDQSWESFFRTNRIVPLRVVYEELEEDFVATMTRICEALGVDLEGEEIPAPALTKQADRVSEEMLKQFRAERASATAG